MAEDKIGLNDQCYKTLRSIINALTLGASLFDADKHLHPRLFLAKNIQHLSYTPFINFGVPRKNNIWVQTFACIEHASLLCQGIDYAPKSFITLCADKDEASLKCLDKRRNKLTKLKLKHLQPI